jgi:hypothetical protein
LEAEVGDTSMQSIRDGSGSNADRVTAGGGSVADATTALMAQVPTITVRSPESRDPVPRVDATQSMQPATTGSRSGSPVAAATAGRMSPTTCPEGCGSGKSPRVSAGSPRASMGRSLSRLVARSTSPQALASL